MGCLCCKVFCLVCKAFLFFFLFLLCIKHWPRERCDWCSKKRQQEIFLSKFEIICKAVTWVKPESLAFPSQLYLRKMSSRSEVLVIRLVLYAFSLTAICWGTVLLYLAAEKLDDMHLLRKHCVCYQLISTVKFRLELEHSVGSVGWISSCNSPVKAYVYTKGLW